MRVMALVPARGGSKGIPRKNIRPFAGSSLLARAVAVGREVCGEDVFVSTDDADIALAAALCGAPHIIHRPADIAKDDTPMLAVVQHAISGRDLGRAMVVPLDVDAVVLLQPTQPLRTAAHVRAALELLERTGADSVVSVVEIPAHYSPDYAVGIDPSNGSLYPRLGFTWEEQPQRRQDCRKAFSRDGTVYAIRRETIERGSLYGTDCRALVIPPNESVNIDTEDDFRRAEAMVNTR